MKLIKEIGMETLRATQPTTRPDFAQVIIGIAGVLHLAASLFLLLAPYSFFMLIAHFPPYNRHDAGDLGAFQLPLGLGLLLAAREPFRYRVVVLIAAVANLLHAINHIYEGLIIPTTLVYWIADVSPLVVMGVALMVVYLRSRPLE
jgi:hypothetical protein